jgi:hypothetical protein
MTSWQVVCLNLAFFGFAAATITFLVVAPWYRTFAGTVLVSVKVDFSLLLGYFWSQLYLPEADTLRTVVLYILYPLTAVTGFALTWVIARAQYTGVHQRQLEQQLFSKHPADEAWNGTERRSPNSPPEEQ